MIEVIRIKKGKMDAVPRDGLALKMQLAEKNLFLCNFISAPRAGKTAVLKGLLPKLQQNHHLAVFLADTNSYEEVSKFGQEDVKLVQVRTDSDGFLDALDLKNVFDQTRLNHSIVLLENNGSTDGGLLIESGAHLDILVHSVSEGDDMPLIYPGNFQKADIVLVNKIDRSDFYNFDLEKFTRRVHNINPSTVVFPVCARDPKSLEDLSELILDKAARALR